MSEIARGAHGDRRKKWELRRRHTQVRTAGIDKHHAWYKYSAIQSGRPRTATVRGICSATWPNGGPPRGVTQGFWLIPVFCSGVCAGGGAVQNDEKGLGEDNNDSSNVPRNMRLRYQTEHTQKLDTTMCPDGMSGSLKSRAQCQSLHQRST